MAFASDADFPSGISLLLLSIDVLVLDRVSSNRVCVVALLDSRVLCRVVLSDLDCGVGGLTGSSSLLGQSLAAKHGVDKDLLLLTVAFGVSTPFMTG